MAHGREEGAFGAVCIIGLVLGLAQVFDQLATLADIDPATDDALYHTQGIAVGENPVVNGEAPVAYRQGTVLDQGLAAGHHLQIVGMKQLRLGLVAKHAVEHRPAADILALARECMQVTVIAGFQQTFAISNIDGMRGAIDQCTHECQLIVQRTLRLFALLDLPAHVGIPDQR
ncbi:hypothetical protein D3C81_1285880 [compost metagenome]